MIGYVGVGAVLLAAAFAGQAHAEAVVEEPGNCAQFYPSANCQNYGPGNPLYPSSWMPAGPAGVGPSPYAAAAVIVHHRYHRRHAYR